MDQKEINNILIKNKRMIELIASNSYYEKFKAYISKEDVIQEAYVITSKLLNRYDNKKGTLSTFLYNNLSKELLRYIHNNMSTVRIPVFIYDIVRQVKKYCNTNNIDTNNIPEDVIRKFTAKLTKDTNLIRRIITDGSICKSVDFDNTFEKDSYYESYSKIDTKIDNEIISSKLEKALQYERKRDAAMIKEYYTTDVKFKDLDAKYHLSRGTASEAIKRVRNRLKNRLMKYKEELLND